MTGRKATIIWPIDAWDDGDAGVTTPYTTSPEAYWRGNDSNFLDIT